MFKHALLAFALFCAAPMGSAVAQSVVTGESEQAEGIPLRIGVLAYLGYEDALARWHGLKLYLDTALPDHHVEIVPMTLASASSQIAAGQIDFVLTNPGHFVTLDAKHPMSVLASRLMRADDGTALGEFGSLIFARADAGIEILDDAKGRRIAAVGVDAFGGFQLAWQTFHRVGIDLFEDTEALVFTGFPMNQVVEAVYSGRADMGILRGGLLEQLIAAGHYEADDFVALNLSEGLAHPYRVSTALSPEWPFAALADTDAALRDRVALALLQAGRVDGAEAPRPGLTWSAPVSYSSVADLLEEYALARAARVRSPLEGLLPFLSLVAAIGGVAALAFTLGRRGRAAALEAAPSATRADATPSLTPREREVLGHIAAGLSTKEIARELNISPKTVEYHRMNLLKKYGARSSAQLIAMTA